MERKTKFPIYGKKNKNVPNHQPEYVDLVVYPCCG
jgi:hypothetical protein